MYTKKNYILNIDKLTYAGNRENTTDCEFYDNYHFIKGDINNYDKVKQTVESLKNMNQADMNKAALEYKKEIKDELNLDGIEGLDMKISKFKIEKNKINSPAFDLKIAANMFNINWDMEVYGYLKNNKPIIVGSECIGKCKGVSGIKNMIVYSDSTSANTSSESSSNIVDNLKELNDLYKSGVLTKEEFEKAKKKLLN